MNPDVMRHILQNAAAMFPSPPLSNRSWPNTPTASGYVDHDHESPPSTPPVKQSWEEFCREQQSRLNTRHTPQNGPGFSLSPGIRPPNNNNRRRNQRRSDLEQDAPGKSGKKRKKPLSSQNAAPKREWGLHDAERALGIEKECNKRSKNALIIKFPDLELSREIVAGFHPDIENVHFQQPSTPRFCFVTLKDSADCENVISALNKREFGTSHLSVEYKKDREEDLNINAKDIDPYTLYVGNLAQEITKDDMAHLYPNSKRIDIGYAKKMKYTRYAFVIFHTIESAIKSFQETHNRQIYNKSLIVRFRRMNGTVGMPGDNKPQNPPKAAPESQGAPPKSPTDDVVEIFRNDNNMVLPFRIKEEIQANVDDGLDDNEGEDEEEDFSLEYSLVHRPKSIKLEIKSEVKPEVYEYFPETKPNIKTEMKEEKAFVESEFNEYSDTELDQEADIELPEDDFEDMYQTFANQRQLATNLRSSLL